MADISTELAQGTPELLEEVIREAEAYLQTQLTASIAADQRAVGFTSLMAAATVAIGTAGTVLVLSENAEAGLAGYVSWLPLDL